MFHSKETIRGFKMIVDGECDQLPEQAFTWSVLLTKPSKRPRHLSNLWRVKPASTIGDLNEQKLKVDVVNAEESLFSGEAGVRCSSRYRR